MGLKDIKRSRFRGGDIKSCAGFVKVGGEALERTVAWKRVVTIGKRIRIF